MGTMRNVWVAGGAVAFLAVAAGFVRAQEGASKEPTYDLRSLVDQFDGEETQAGDVFTTTQSESQEVSMSVSRPDGSSQDQQTAQLQEARYVVRFDAYSEESELWTKSVHVDDWSMNVDGTVDDSLDGTVLVATGEDYTVSASGGELSGAAEEWLREEILDGSGDDEDPDDEILKAAMFAEHPVAVGERWEVDADSLRELMSDRFGDDMELASFSGWGRMTEIAMDDDGKVARFAMEMELEGVIAKVIENGMEMPCDDGSTFTATIEVSGSPPTGAMTMTATMELSVGVTMGEGVGLKVDATANLSEVTEPGGEIPEVAEDDE